MQILFLNSIGKRKWGGGEKCMLMSAAGLASKGLSVLIGCAPNSIIEKNAHSQGLKTVNISFSTDFDLFGFFRLIHILRKHKISHLICGQNKDSKIGAIAALHVKGVTVIARHGLQLIRKKWKYKFIFSQLLDGIITNSNTIKTEYDSYNWFQKDFVKVIYNGFNLPEVIDHIDLKKIFNIPPDALTVISAGRLAKQKGFEVLIDVAEIALKEKKPWYFIVAGKGKLERKLKQMVAYKKLQDRFFFMGFVEDVLPYVKSADLFVLPSYYEGMPNAVMEAMGMGKCCVVTSVNGNNELITHLKEGLLVEPGNSQQLYEAIAHVSKDKHLRKEMGENALTKIGTLFSEDRMIDELEDFLQTKTQII